MQTLNKLYAIQEKLRGFFLALGGIGVFSMMIYITVDVVYRNVTGKALVGTFEVVSYYIMPLTILPSMCMALSAGVLPRIVAVTDRLPQKVSRVIYIILPILEILVYAIMLVFSTRYAISATKDNLTFIAGTKSLPVWFMYYLPVLTYIMLILESLFVLAKNILTGNTTLLFNGPDPDEENAAI